MKKKLLEIWDWALVIYAAIVMLMGFLSANNGRESEATYIFANSAFFFSFVVYTRIQKLETKLKKHFGGKDNVSDI